MRVFLLVWHVIVTASFAYFLVVFVVPMLIRYWSINPATGILFLVTAAITTLAIAVQVFGIVRLVRGRALYGPDSTPTSAALVDRPRIERAVAALDTVGGQWWPALRERVVRFLEMPDQPERWELRARLLQELYDVADRGLMPFDERRRANDLRRAINLEIDAS